jgi:calcineurin-like phosphoesterase family protein
MNDDLVRKWNSCVKKTDTVFHLGDFALCKKEQLLEIVPKLNGRITLVMGNHDKFSPATYMEAGIETVSRFPIIIMDFLMLSHAPLFIEAQSCRANIHGHVHNSLPYRPSAYYWNVSVECTGYKPVCLNTILTEINKQGGDVK